MITPPPIDDLERQVTEWQSFVSPQPQPAISQFPPIKPMKE
jgi:hypothetical protein